MTVSEPPARVESMEWAGVLLVLAASSLVRALTDGTAGTAVAVALLVVATVLGAVATVRTVRHGTASRTMAGATLVLLVLQWVLLPLR